ncbi:P-loop containing nucleoside triphosphate hydrolase [Pseudocohnilembus persalinus]|uniref:p-loop containing nucleoside triphosphate hydrolase n=1 Tax=Pseudocohnilembus persalinus TaxID=266149 RepID=A0A0V0QSQ9_PSEPJ|nr:P-loop containing nucleoside triphosphate hydrolase [Pseudocohnilembus persalinus]|eukprot:KRX05223.1 P-loop containing nucleoside triphosphate hydrolase [Pseudocohnilembus persalinus]
MTDLQKTIEENIEDFSDNQSESGGVELEQSGNDFFSGITGAFKKKQTESNEIINKEITKQVLSSAKRDNLIAVSTTNEKVQKLQEKKNRFNKNFEQKQLNVVEQDEEDGKLDKETREKLIQAEFDNAKEDMKKEKELSKKTVKQTTWEDLKLHKALLKSVDDLDYTFPTKIQELCIPTVLSGKDILASSLTGSGKTAAFLLPLIQKLYKSTPQNYSKVLIVLPTRELAFQCYEMFQNLNKYTRLRAALIIGAVPMQKQEAELRRYPEFIIATPGRLLDHLTNSQSIDLDNLEYLVFDEADKLLDLGFTAEVTQIAKESNQDRQTLLFSATLNQDVNKLVGISMKKPIRLNANPDSQTSDKLKQFVLKISEEKYREPALLALCTKFYKDQTLIFFRTKRECHKMAIILGLMGIKVCELHGNMNQSQRIESFEDFKSGKFDFLLATDLAARGLDIKELKAVINFELPQEVTRYIHRVGRTARAGQRGVCITICVDYDILKLKKLMGKDRNKLEKVFLDESTQRNLMAKIKGFERDVENIMKQETGEKQLRKAEIELQKAENMLKHKDEIMNRPKKSWFQTNRDKNINKRAAKEALDKDDFTEQNNNQQSFKKNNYGPPNKNNQNKGKFNNNKKNGKANFNKKVKRN